jgi:hypothetical protein
MRSIYFPMDVHHDNVSPNQMRTEMNERQITMAALETLRDHFEALYEMTEQFADFPASELSPENAHELRWIDNPNHFTDGGVAIEDKVSAPASIAYFVEIWADEHPEWIEHADQIFARMQKII